ncbi:MAG: hypothetical protein IJZ32_04480 [Clostridia bacterium]|nr:hypothetical protein [Clostridia bacterium]
MEKFIEVLRLIMIIEQIILILFMVVLVIAGAIAYCKDTSDKVKFPKNETAERVYQEYVVKHYKNQNKKD